MMGFLQYKPTISQGESYIGMCVYSYIYTHLFVKHIK